MTFGRATAFGLLLASNGALLAQSRNGDATVDRWIKNARATPPDCTPAEPNAIIVCGQRGANSPYRMPSGHRSEDISTEEKGWGGRARTLSRLGRDMMPGSNSVVGSDGQSGWAEGAVHDWYDDRQQKGLRAPSKGYDSPP